jgi:hypothetical protein
MAASPTNPEIAIKIVPLDKFMIGSFYPVRRQGDSGANDG